MTNEVDKIEELIDQTWGNLQVYEFPLNLAVFMVLASFEHYLASPLTTRLPYTRKLLNPIEITHLRQGLQELVPMLFKRCKATAFKYSRIKDLRNLNTPYTYAAQAMNYCQKYEWMAYHLTAYRQGLCECQVKERVITFTIPSQAVLAQSLIHHLLHQYREMRSRDEKSLSNISLDSPYEKITESLKKAIKHIGPEEFLHRIPNDVFETYKSIVLASAPSPTIEENASFSIYSVKEYYDFWVTLSSLMISYLEACKIKYGNDDKRLMNSRVVIIHPDDLANIVAGKCGGVSYHLARQIVQELTLDPSQKRPDIQIQPIIQIASDILFLAPHLIFTSNWEVCLLRNWAKASPGRYGEVVASKKDKLTDELAETIQSMRLTIVKRKKLFDQEGKLIGDVDLAIFDKSMGFLIIAEIKWVIEPDSFQDESHAREELSKGIKQLRICQSLIGENIEHFTSEFFGDDVKHNDIKEVLYVLLSHGGLDCRFDAEEYNIHLLDYVLSLDVIKSNLALSIKDLFLKIIAMHERAKKVIEKNTTIHRLKISGYLLETQGIKRDIQSKADGGDNFKSYPVNQPCPCGSGKRYKDCCKTLEPYEEDVNRLQDDG